MTSEQHNLRVDAAIFPSSYSPQRGSLGFDQTKRLTLTGWKLWSPVIGVSSSVLVEVRGGLCSDKLSIVVRRGRSSSSCHSSRLSNEEGRTGGEG